FIAVANDRGSGKCHHHAVGKFQMSAISFQHGSEPASNPALIELHTLGWTEGREDGFALFLAEASKIKFIVIAKEVSPLDSCGTGLCVLERFDERRGVV